MKKSIRDIQDWQGKRVLVREDFNVPMDENGRITDDLRIREALPTLKYLAAEGARVIVMSHLGRPKGKRDPKASLEPVADHLRTLLPETMVYFSPDVYSDNVVRQIADMQPGEVLVLENVRFEPGEEANDPAFAQKLASLGDIYVNDAFGSAHRAHASTEGIARYLRPAVAGLLMEKEIRMLSEILDSDQPLTAIIGGSKISTKITVLENLLPKVRYLVIGGGMLFTFLKAEGYDVGKSLVEEEHVGTARALIERAREMNDVTLVLATDAVIAERFAADASSRVVDADAIPADWMGLDIGPASLTLIRQVLEKSPLILWNGPMGVFEFPRFAEGTKEVAETIAEMTSAGKCKSVLGGGDTLAAIEQFGIDRRNYTHVSTGGGASLEFLEGKVLPGIAVLEDAPAKAVAGG